MPRWQGARAGAQQDEQREGGEVPPVWGASEIAGYAHVTMSTVHSWRQRYADFPPPLLTLACGSLYDVDAVTAWVDAYREGPRRPRRRRSDAGERPRVAYPARPAAAPAAPARATIRRAKDDGLA